MTLTLRPVIIDDLPTLFEQQRDPGDMQMVRWSRLVNAQNVTRRAIEVGWG